MWHAYSSVDKRTFAGFHRINCFSEVLNASYLVNLSYISIIENDFVSGICISSFSK